MQVLSVRARNEIIRLGGACENNRRPRKENVPVTTNAKTDADFDRLGPCRRVAAWVVDLFGDGSQT